VKHILHAEWLRKADIFVKNLEERDVRMWTSINLAQNEVQWWSLLNIVMNLWVP
jgi:hypothetical protein